jgi:hypothetical protein
MKQLRNLSPIKEFSSREKIIDVENKSKACLAVKNIGHPDEFFILLTFDD